MPEREFTAEEVKDIGDRIGVDWTVIPLDEFGRGLRVFSIATEFRLVGLSLHRTGLSQIPPMWRFLSITVSKVKRTEVWRMEGGNWRQWVGHATPVGQ